ncbi:hypothetical protein KR054_003313, partial [Drosophila jambulina]
LNLFPGVVGECVDCNKVIKFPCQVNRTGYYCEPGSEVSVNYVPGNEHITARPKPIPGSFDECTPPVFNLDYVNTVCCLYSPKLGCQMAINPSMLAYENRPIGRCKECIQHCHCLDSGSIPLQPWTLFCTLGSLTL